MQSQDLVELAHTLAEHQDVSHWTISNRIFGNGTFFSRLMDGKNCWQTNADKAARWFGENWPDDLKWPENIEKPAKQIDDLEAA